MGSNIGSTLSISAGFKWPPKMPSFKFKDDRNYKYMAYVFSNNCTLDEEPKYKVGFMTEREAQVWKKVTERAIEKPIVIVTKIPVADEDGYIA